MSIKQTSFSSMSQWIDEYFAISNRKSSFRQELFAGLTTYLAMIYSVVAVPNMLGNAGFPKSYIFIATCVVAGAGSIIMGLWARLPMAIGCAISLTVFTAYSLVIGQGVAIPVALGAVFLMGVIFTFISVTGIRRSLLRNIPIGIAHGTGAGIGLFLLMVAATSPDVGIIVANTSGGLPIKFGDFTSFSVLAALIGLALTIALEKMKVTGGILSVIILISIVGLVFDPNLDFQQIISISQQNTEPEKSLFMAMDIKGALTLAVLPSVLALVMTAIFDATGTIRAVAGQANLLDKNGQIIDGDKALTADSVSSIISGVVGVSPAAVYIESAAGTAAGGRTGLTAVIVGILFILTLFLAPIAHLIPMYATAPALMYVGLLMLGNVSKLDFNDFIDAMSGLICAVFIVFTANIVTGIMLGFAGLVIGRLFSGEFHRLNLSTIIVTILLVAFYAGGFAI